MPSANVASQTIKGNKCPRREGESNDGRKRSLTRHISMKGGGYYSKATIGAKDVIDGGTPMIMEALSTMDIPDIATPFTMADPDARTVAHPSRWWGRF